MDYASNEYMARPGRKQILRRGQKEKVRFCPEGVHKVDLLWMTERTDWL